MRMLAVIALIVIIAGTVAGSTAAFVYLTSPRMFVQENVRAYQQEARPLPEGVVPVNTWPRLPSEEAAKTLANPAPTDEAAIARGKTYYEYYCVFCHGDKGDGNGPVGQSYTPTPTDLRTPKIQGYSDGQILRTMLIGTGHEPVLEKVVLPEHRWYLVHYVRNLASAAPK